MTTLFHQQEGFVTPSVCIFLTFAVDHGVPHRPASSMCTSINKSVQQTDPGKLFKDWLLTSVARNFFANNYWMLPPFPRRFF
ncbi:MAG: hypothetical protein ABSB78_10595 [Bacteroidota bacterium]